MYLIDCSYDLSFLFYRNFQNYCLFSNICYTLLCQLCYQMWYLFFDHSFSSSWYTSTKNKLWTSYFIVRRLLKLHDSQHFPCGIHKVISERERYVMFQMPLGLYPLFQGPSLLPLLKMLKMPMLSYHFLQQLSQKLPSAKNTLSWFSFYIAPVKYFSNINVHANYLGSC